MKIPHCVLMALLAAYPAQAEWAQKDYASEYDACVPNCDKNNPREHEKCVSYCGCVTDQMQAQYLDHNQLVQDAVQQKLSGSIARLQRIADHCNHQTWGNPARKLKFR